VSYRPVFCEAAVN